MLPRTRVRLVDVPVALFCASEQHSSDLLREIALMAAARPEEGHLFTEIMTAAEAYAQRPASVRNRIAEAVAVAVARGEDSTTVDFDADVNVADGALAWEELLRRFDALSRNERLLTLPADAELTAYRAWYVGELVEQVRTGRAPVSWHEARSRALAGAAS